MKQKRGQSRYILTILFWERGGIEESFKRLIDIKQYEELIDETVYVAFVIDTVTGRRVYLKYN